MIRFELPKASHVSLVIYDLGGRQITQLESGVKTAGVHLVRWDGRDNAGNRVPSGVYFYRLEAAETNGVATTLTKKLTVMK
jgi:flagellar hook assembly protein FlgD